MTSAERSLILAIYDHLWGDYDPETSLRRPVSDMLRIQECFPAETFEELEDALIWMLDQGLVWECKGDYELSDDGLDWDGTMEVEDD